MEDPLEGSDDDPMLGMTDEEIANFDWDGWMAGQTYEPIPGEVDAQGWNSDFTDSGIQTETDQPMSMEEIIYDQTGPDAPLDEDVPGVKGWKKKLEVYNQRGKGKGQFSPGDTTAMNPVLRRGIEKKRTLITG
jgi:hypothetical protein